MGDRVVGAEAIERVVTELYSRGWYDEVTAILRQHHVLHHEAWGNARHAPIVKARAAVFRYIRETYGWSYPAIAKCFGFDRSSVEALINTRVRDRVETPSQKERRLELLKDRTVDFRKTPLVVFLSLEERQACVAEARRCKEVPSTWARQVLLRAIQGETGDKTVEKK